jgi:hypothetical protein
MDITLGSDPWPKASVQPKATNSSATPHSRKPLMVAG